MSSFVITKWMRLSAISVLTHILKEDELFYDPTNKQKNKIFNSEKEAKHYLLFQCKETRIRFLTGNEKTEEYRIMKKKGDYYEKI